MKTDKFIRIMLVVIALLLLLNLVKSDITRIVTPDASAQLLGIIQDIDLNGSGAAIATDKDGNLYVTDGKSVWTGIKISDKWVWTRLAQ